MPSKNIITREKLQRVVQDTRSAPLLESMRTDSALASNIAKELQYTYTEVIKQEHPDKPFGMGQIVPIDSRPGSGARTYIYYEMGGTATAVVLNTYASNELPIVGLFARKHTGTIESFGNAWDYNVDDLQAAAESNITGALLQEKPNLAQEGHVQAWNDTGLFGDDAHGWNGFLNHPNVPTLAATVNWTGPFATQAAIDVVMSEVDTLLNTAFFNTNGRHKANRLLVPQKVWTTWKFQRVSFTAGDMTTMLQYLEAAHSDVQIGWLLECDATKSGGRLADSRAISYVGGNQDIVAFVRTLDFTQHVGYWDGLRFLVPCQSKFGGTKWVQPLTGAITSGVLQ